MLRKASTCKAGAARDADHRPRVTVRSSKWLASLWLRAAFASALSGLGHIDCRKEAITWLSNDLDNLLQEYQQQSVVSSMQESGRSLSLKRGSMAWWQHWYWTLEHIKATGDALLARSLLQSTCTFEHSC